MTDTEKLRKAAYLLGLATGTLISVKEKYGDIDVTVHLQTLQKGIEELFYSEAKDEQNSTI